MPYLLAESVGASQPESWIDISADTAVTTDADLWLVAFWQARATGPQMGEDREAPIDRRTYFGSPTVRWFAYNSGDVMARLRIDGQTGVSEVTPTGLTRLEVTPNPFRHTAMVSLRHGSTRSLEVRDATGRHVRELRPANPALRSGTDATRMGNGCRPEPISSRRESAPGARSCKCC